MKEIINSDMNGPAERVAYLIAGYVRKTLTEAEHDELDNWVNESDANMKLFEDLTDEKNIEANLKLMEDINSQAAFEKLKAEGKFDLSSRKSYSIFWWVAASVLLIVGGYFLYSNSQKNGKNNGGLAKNDSSHLKADPTNGVMLTLEDGTTIDISSLQNGVIQAGYAIKENDSVLNYGETEVVQNHVLKTPSGKIFQLKLPDGSEVWLNASSSLKFPTRFAGNERVVEVEGEGYFEIAKDVARPFKVIMQDSSVVTVLGTHFNVNAYDSNNKEVTLMEGAVVVSKNAKTVKLSPGTLVKIAETGPGNPIKADIDAIMGWKNGLFVFKDADIKEIMSQLEQWFNVKAVYNGNIQHQFNATFSRKDNLNQILKLLELNGNVHFKTENNIVYVQP